MMSLAVKLAAAILLGVAYIVVIWRRRHSGI
jgi:hypothetical protein